jgi:hypothetical protein
LLYLFFFFCIINFTIIIFLCLPTTLSIPSHLLSPPVFTLPPILPQPVTTLPLLLTHSQPTDLPSVPTTSPCYL